MACDQYQQEQDDGVLPPLRDPRVGDVTQTLAQDQLSEPFTCGDPDIEHYCCDCSPDIALCGADLEGAEFLEIEDSPDDCVVCVDLKDKTCPRCGETVIL